MKNKFNLTLRLGFSLFLTCFLSCSDEKNNNVVKIEAEEISEQTPENTNEGDWQLVFEEEFDTNLDKWNVWSGGAFNNEIQLYKREQMTLQNGILTIKAEKKSVNGATNPFDPTTKVFEYVSGRIETKAQFGPSSAAGENEYRILSRIKLAAGNGMWPAFWTYTNPWPTKGEIDIVEYRGNETTKYHSNIFYGTEINTPLTKNEDTSKAHELNKDLTTDFHTYELIWKAESLDVLFDGQLMYTYNADDKNFVAELFNNKHQVVLNLAVGGGFFEGVNSNTFVNASSMQVDWIKVFKR